MMSASPVATVVREWRSASVVLFLAVAFTWPLADLRNPQLPLHDDAMFSVWRLAWVAHQLPRDPGSLFHANIFWPETHTLAFSDAMLLLGVVAAPLIWTGIHPIVAHNLLLIASFVGAAFGAMRLLRYLHVGSAGQFVGGLIFAFAPYRVGHIGHLELLWTAFIPLSLVAMYRALEKPTPGRGAMLGVTLALQGLCSIYYLAFLALWLVPALVVAPWHVRLTWRREHGIAAAAAVLTVVALLAPYAYVYANARENVGVRPVNEIRRYSAAPADYLNVPEINRLYARQSPESEDERSLFLGLMAMALAGVSLVRRANAAVIPFAILGVVAFDLSLGVNGITYNVLRALVPAVDSFRAPARFAVLVLLSISVLAGVAIDEFCAMLRGRVAHAILGGVAVVVLVEYWSAPLPVATRPVRPPAVYEWLAAQPRTVILELPVPTPDRLWRYESTFQYLSTFHWQPMLNGYSGYAPLSYVRMLDAVANFPHEEAVQFVASRGVTLVLLHERFMPHGEFDRLLAACSDAGRFAAVRVFHDAWLQRSAVCRFRQR